jgi:heterodisulfide reductase subunit A
MASKSSQQKNKHSSTDTNIRDFLHLKGVTLQFPEISASFPIQEIRASPCRVACPAGVNIKAYLGAIARGDFEKALKIVKLHNPLPGICGRVCTHPCESECRRGEFDESLAICALKRFIADYELRHGVQEVEPCERTEQARVAVVGSGPAGLTVASDLVRLGYGVTVFEALSVAGGMLVVGIPPYRLPRDIIKTEIDSIMRLGVELRIRTRVEDIDRLFKDGYDAVFLALGAHRGLKLRVEGEDDYAGVEDCIEFLRRVNRGDRVCPGDRVVVIGGGNSAVDSARSALRLGCRDVRIVYRRSRQEMPASEEEIVEAEHEGIKIDYLAAPVKVLGRAGRVIGVECTRMELGAPDQSGRRRPIPIAGSEFVIDVDSVISAISQKPDIDCFHKCGLKITRWDTFEVDEATLITSRPGVFAGGDAVTGPNTVIDAIAAGHRAARAIDRYLHGETLKEERIPGIIQRELNPEGFSPERAARIHAPKIPLEQRRASFAEVELTLSEKAAIREAKRCLRCGPCVECIHCVKECPKRAVGISTATGKEFIMAHGMPKGMQEQDVLKGVLAAEGKEGVEVKVEPIVSEVNQEMCRGCGQCEEVCDYSAVKVEEKEDGVKVAQVDVRICKGCGTCASVCPTGAVHLRFFKSKDIEAELEDFFG